MLTLSTDPRKISSARYERTFRWDRDCETAGAIRAFARWRFLVPAAHKTERDNIVDDRHNDWARPWIKDYTKISYELRRYAGSLILKKTGSMKAVQKYLGHSSIATTEKWYAYSLGELPALSFADFTNGHNLG